MAAVVNKSAGLLAESSAAAGVLLWQGVSRARSHSYQLLCCIGHVSNHATMLMKISGLCVCARCFVCCSLPQPTTATDKWHLGHSQQQLLQRHHWRRRHLHWYMQRVSGNLLSVLLGQARAMMCLSAEDETPCHPALSAKFCGIKLLSASPPLFSAQLTS